MERLGTESHVLEFDDDQSGRRDNPNLKPKNSFLCEWTVLDANTMFCQSHNIINYFFLFILFSYGSIRKSSESLLKELLLVGWIDLAIMSSASYGSRIIIAESEVFFKTGYGTFVRLKGGWESQPEIIPSMGRGRKCDAVRSFFARMPFMHFPFELIPKCHGRLIFFKNICSENYYCELRCFLPWFLGVYIEWMNRDTSNFQIHFLWIDIRLWTSP